MSRDNLSQGHGSIVPTGVTHCRTPTSQRLPVNTIRGMQQAQQVTSMRILVVDDDVVFAETLSRALSRFGHDSVFRNSAEEALELVHRQHFDALVLDLRLGSRSALHYIAPLRAIRPEIRILLLTGFASIATAVEAIKLGATHYLAKPAGVDEILAALNNIPGDNTAAPSESPLTLHRLEWEHIQKILVANDGNLSATARALRMHRRTLQRKLAKRPAKA